MEAPLHEDAYPIAATPLAAEEVAAADVRREESSRTSSLRGGGGWSGLRPLFLPIKAPPHHRGPTLFRSRLMPRDKEQGHPSSSLNRFSPRPSACQRPRGGSGKPSRPRGIALALPPPLSVPQALSLPPVPTPPRPCRRPLRTLMNPLRCWWTRKVRGCLCAVFPLTPRKGSERTKSLPGQGRMSPDSLGGRSPRGGTLEHPVPPLRPCERAQRDVRDPLAGVLRALTPTRPPPAPFFADDSSRSARARPAPPFRKRRHPRCFSFSHSHTLSLSLSLSLTHAPKASPWTRKPPPTSLPPPAPPPAASPRRP